MAPRKRSYKAAGDKWFGTWLHNASVDDHRERRTNSARKERLAAIRSRLASAGIDQSWAEVSLGIMKSNGFGLNQFSNRVLPVLHERMRDCSRKEDRKARAGELRNIDARTRNEAVAEAKQNEANLRKDRKALAFDVKTSANNAKKATWSDPGLDIGAAKHRALSATMADLSSDIRGAKSVLDKPFSSIHEVRLALSKSLFLDYTSSGFFKCLAWLGLDALVAYSAFKFVDSILGPPSQSSQAIALILFVVFLGVPILMIRHLAWLMRPRLTLSMPFVEKRYRQHFLANVMGQRVLPPAIKKSDIPQDVLNSIDEIKSGLRLALQKRSA
jgi:hypothetical protein